MIASPTTEGSLRILRLLPVGVQNISVDCDAQSIVWLGAYSAP
jgi:hypothetical protein